jgi:alkylhydroperoxidase family enzyme
MTTSFLCTAEPTDSMRDHDVEQVGHVMNLSMLWAHLPTLHEGLFDVMARAAKAATLTFRQRGVLVVATASTFGDAYCSLVWGRKLANVAGDEVAGAVVRGDDEPLGKTERALARWARAMTRDPNTTEPADVQALRDVGYDDARILAITTFVALRAAFAAVNDALGVRPDREAREAAPDAVRSAVTYGRASISL